MRCGYLQRLTHKGHGILDEVLARCLLGIPYGSLLQCLVARGDEFLDAHALAGILPHKRYHEA